MVTAALVLALPLVAAALLGGRYADGAKEALFRRTLAGLPADELAAASAFAIVPPKTRLTAARRRGSILRARTTTFPGLSASLKARRAGRGRNANARCA